MLTEKIVVGAFMLIWRVIRVLGLLAIGGRRQPAIANTQAAEAYWSPPRRAFGDSMTWVTVLALMGIGIPLATTDPAFTATATQNIHTIIQLASQIADEAGQIA